MTNKTTFAFTGIPGTGVKAAMANAKDYCTKEFGWTIAEPLCIDDLLREEILQDLKNAHGTNSGLQEVLNVTPPVTLETLTWESVLKLPATMVREYWLRAAKKAHKLIHSERRAKYFFVSFHAAYHSEDYSWRFCPVDVNYLGSFGFNSFVTLIDDIHDLWHGRTKERGRIFADLSAHFPDNPKDLTRSFINRKLRQPLAAALHEVTTVLGQYITLRQEEIQLTGLFAYASRRLHHVVAVKHHRQTLGRLLRDPTKSVYFSHPISAPRRNQQIPSGITDITEAARRLRDTVTLIEPTAIDEQRITHQIVGKKIVEKKSTPIPRLGERWPLPNESPDSCIQCSASFTNRAPLLHHHTSIVPESFPQLVDLLFDDPTLAQADLVALMGKIKEDISWRDFTLVAQTGRLAVFRPFPNGEMANGVAFEIYYLARIWRTSGLKQRWCVVYHPEEDQQLFKKYCAGAIVDDLNKKKLIRSAVTTSAALESLIPVELSTSQLPNLCETILESLKPVITATGAGSSQLSNVQAGYTKAIEEARKNCKDRIAGLLGDWFYLYRLAEEFPRGIFIHKNEESWIRQTAQLYNRRH